MKNFGQYQTLNFIDNVSWKLLKIIEFGNVSIFQSHLRIITQNRVLYKNSYGSYFIVDAALRWWMGIINLNEISKHRWQELHTRKQNKALNVLPLFSSSHFSFYCNKEYNVL